MPSLCRHFLLAAALLLAAPHALAEEDPAAGPARAADAPSTAPSLVPAPAAPPLEAPAAMPPAETVRPVRLVEAGGPAWFWNGWERPEGWPDVDLSEGRLLLDFLPEEERATTDRTWDSDAALQRALIDAQIPWESMDPDQVHALLDEPLPEGVTFPPLNAWMQADSPFLYRSRSTHDSIQESRERIAADRARRRLPPHRRTTILYDSGVEETPDSFEGPLEPGPTNAWIVRTFDVDDPSRFAALGMELEFSAGARVWLNGTEITAQNVAPHLREAGNVAAPYRGPTWMRQMFWNRWQRDVRAIDPALLVAGENRLAVKLYRREAGGMRAMFFDVHIDAYETRGFSRSPYLQASHDGQVTVRWETNFPAHGAVRFGRDGHALDRIVHAPSVDGWRHEVTLPGLEPDTRYAYEVLSWAHPFAGQPAATEPHVSQRYAFTSWADGDRYSFIAYGDNRSRPDAHRSVIEAMWPVAHEINARFILHGGDMTMTGTARDEWQDEFFHPILPLPAWFPLFTVIGNHEQNHERYYDVFSMPGNETWYSFRQGPAEFFIFNVDYDHDDQSAQYRWLDEALGSSDATWKIVSMHHPPFSCPPARKPGHAGMREYMVPLFERHNVQLVIASHDHLYGRTREINGVTYVTTGGGGAPLYPAVTDDDNIICERRLHFCTVDVSPEAIHLRAITPEGDVLDSFTLRASP